VEYLNRGLSVGNTGNGVLVSWRLLASDAPNTGFNLYRDGTKVATIDATQGTNYLDAKGSVTAKYTVAPVVNGVEGAQAGASVVLGSTNSGHSYTTIKLDVPANQTMPDGSTCSYTPNDMSAGDLDGDGEMDLVLKWDPSNSKDNSQSGYTGSVIIDGLKLDGTRLWRIDLGKNIRAGAHYTQFMVYDLDGDGISEIVMKTSDGTVDGKGTVIGDKSKDYRTSTGTIMSGNEYLTVFNGKTGAAINTIDYWPKRDITNKWGDTYGNRSERMLAAVAYLDGVHPSVVFSRGYYTAAYVAAYNFDGKKLTQIWQHKSETSGQGLYGQGNHNLSVGDMDGDGYDEIATAPCCTALASVMAMPCTCPTWIPICRALKCGMFTKKRAPNIPTKCMTRTAKSFGATCSRTRAWITAAAWLPTSIPPAAVLKCGAAKVAVSVLARVEN